MNRSSARRLFALWLLCWAGMGWPQGCAAQNLPKLSAGALRDLLSNPNSQYALVTRPSDADYHQVDLLELHPVSKLPASRTPTPLGCNRVHASSQGSVFCYSRVKPTAPRNYSKPTGYVYTRDFKLQKNGGEQEGVILSRARMSADGKFTASTAFVNGHSYLSGPGQFSTASHIAAAQADQAPENIQRWQVLRSGSTFAPPDINLWGVTFDPLDSNRFFVTVHSNGTAHLAVGNVAARQIQIVAAGIECPSFSPDGKRLAFKKRVSTLRWAPAVLDLSTMVETVYKEARYSVDDQIEWLDDRTLIYEIAPSIFNGKASTDLYTLDLRAEPAVESLWLVDARSPTFVGSRLAR
jgi:dipeptidyl aminopeptidase/acylaminoacyl peptidase